MGIAWPRPEETVLEESWADMASEGASAMVEAIAPTLNGFSAEETGRFLGEAWVAFMRVAKAQEEAE